MEYASYSEAPSKSLWWAGVSAIAGALQRNVWIDQGLFQIYPNFFIIINGPPGKVKKSTIVNLSMNLLKGVEGINFAPSSTTWEGLIQLMEDLHKVEQEGLGIATKFTRTIPITVAAPEFSVFLDFEDHGKVSALTDLWDCPPAFRKHTKFSGDEYLEKPCINLIAGTTPAWIKQSFNEWSREGGFASRCIWLHETNKSKAVPFLLDVLPKDYKTTEQRLTTDLAYMTRLNGPFSITKEAHDYEVDRYKNHDRAMAEALEVRLGGFQDRKQVHILKTAMAIAAGRSDNMVIDLRDIQLAATKVDEAENDMVRSFAIVDERLDLRSYREIRGLIDRQGRVKVKALFSSMAGKHSYHEISQAIDVIKNQDDIQLVSENGDHYLTKRSDPTHG